jgi:hypothetical protein
MTTIELEESPSSDELLAIGRREAVLLVSPADARFVLNETDDFDREVAELGSGHVMAVRRGHLSSPWRNPIRRLVEAGIALICVTSPARRSMSSARIS